MFKKIVNPNQKGRARQHYACEFNNGVYEGDMLHYRKDGIGMLIHDDGTVYFGGFASDNFHGEGVVVFPLGGMLYGQFEKGKVNGFGIVSFQGSVLCGYFSQSLLHGRVYNFSSLTQQWTFSEFQIGQKIHDFAQEKTVSETQQCSFLLRDILLSTKYADFLELRLENIFKKNVNSSLTLLACNENPSIKYVGFLDGSGKMSGLGCILAKSVAQMSGRYVNGSIQGLGRVFHQNGDIYEGILRNDKMQGKGFYYKKSSNSYFYAEFKESECIQVLHDGIDFPSQLCMKMKFKSHQRSISYMNVKIDLSMTSLFLSQIFTICSKEKQILPSSQLQTLKQQTRRDFSCFEVSPKKKHEIKNELQFKQAEQSVDKRRQVRSSSFVQLPRRNNQENLKDGSIFILSPSREDRESPRKPLSSSRIFLENRQTLDRTFDLTRESNIRNQLSYSREVQNAPESSKIMDGFLNSSDNLSTIRGQTVDLSPFRARKYQPIFHTSTKPVLRASYSRNPNRVITLAIPNEIDFNESQLLTSRMRKLSESIASPTKEEHLVPRESAWTKSPLFSETKKFEQPIDFRVSLGQEQYYSPEFNPRNLSLNDIMRTINHSGNFPPPQLSAKSDQIDDQSLFRVSKNKTQTPTSSLFL